MVHEVFGVFALIPKEVYLILGALILAVVGRNAINEARYKTYVFASKHYNERKQQFSVSDRDEDRMVHYARLIGAGAERSEKLWLKGSNIFFVFGPRTTWDEDTAKQFDRYRRTHPMPTKPVVAIATCGRDESMDEFGRPQEGRKFSSKSKDYNGPV